MSLTIRDTVPEDLPELLAIYNYEVEHGVSTFDLNKKDMRQWREWYGYLERVACDSDSRG